LKELKRIAIFRSNRQSFSCAGGIKGFHSGWTVGFVIGAIGISCVFVGKGAFADVIGGNLIGRVAGAICMGKLHGTKACDTGAFT
jgi:hypothetical protein